MKIIIDIPEERYEWIKRCNHHYQLSEEDVMSLLNGVKNGTPLDDVKEQMKKTRRFYVGTFEDEAIAILDNIGKADMRGE